MIIGFSFEYIYIYIYECMIPDQNMGRCLTICVLDSCCMRLYWDFMHLKYLMHGSTSLLWMCFELNVWMFPACFIWKGPCDSGLKYYCLHFDKHWACVLACVSFTSEHEIVPCAYVAFSYRYFFYICVMPVISYPGSLCALRRIQISKSVCASLHELIWLLVGRWRSFSSFSFINHFVACGSDNLLDQQYGFGGSASILMVWYWAVQ